MGAQSTQDESTISKKEKNGFLKKIPYQNWKLWAVCSSVLLVLLVVSLITGGFRTMSANNASYEAIDLKGKTVSEACEIAKSNGWTPYITIWSSGNDDRQGDCYSNLEVQKFEYDSGYCWGVSESTKTKKNVCITAYDNGYTGPDDAKSREAPAASESGSSTDSSSTSNPAPSSSSGSSSSSSSDSMCKSDYQKDLDAAKTAYEAAKSTYDTYKSLGVDASTLETYQSTLDLAKTSLDAAQKIYDTYCK